MNTKACREESRSLLAAVLLSDPSARQRFNELTDKGAEDFYPGTFYYRIANGSMFRAAIDATCWFCKSYKTNRVYMLMRNVCGAAVEWRVFETERLDHRLP